MLIVLLDQCYPWLKNDVRDPFGGLGINTFSDVPKRGSIAFSKYSSFSIALVILFVSLFATFFLKFSNERDNAVSSSKKYLDMKRH